MIYVDDINKGNPIKDKGIWFSYYNEDTAKWVTLKGKTSSTGTTMFKVPSGKTGESATFLYAFSEKENLAKIDDIKNGKILGFRIPPKKDQERLKLKID